MGKTIENYSLQVLLGSGGYSQVYKAINTKTNEVVAIKMIKSDKFKELPKLQQGTVNEINILSTLKPCPYIIRYFDMLKTANNFYFVYEFCNGGTLQQMLKKVQYLPQQQALIYFRQIMQAFKVLTKHNIMHRDLKPENILLHNDCIKIADFGFCKVLQNEQEMAHTMLGSPIYMAPEILKGETYTIKADIWSLGVVLFRMLFGYCPYQSSNIAKLIMLMENDELVIPSEPRISPILSQLITRMLVKNPAGRADWNQVFSYEISQNGYIRQVRDVSQSSGKSSFVNDWTTKASNSGHSRMVNMDRSGTRQGGSSKTIRVKETVERPYNSKQQIERQGLQFQRQRSYRDEFSRNMRDKSPHQHHISKTEIYARNHVKCLQLANLSLEIYAYQSQFSLSVAFLIGKQLQKQYDQITESINLENNYDIYKMFSDQARELKYILSMYCQQLLERQIDYYCLQDRYKQTVKQFVNSLRLETSEETIMVERILAWFDSKLIMKKEVYQKFSKEQLKRQINGKLAQF